MFALEQECSARLLKVERAVSDRFLKRSGPRLNNFVGAEIETEPLIVLIHPELKLLKNQRFQCKESPIRLSFYTAQIYPGKLQKLMNIYLY